MTNAAFTPHFHPVEHYSHSHDEDYPLYPIPYPQYSLSHDEDYPLYPIAFPLAPHKFTMGNEGTTFRCQAGSSVLSLGGELHP